MHQVDLNEAQSSLQNLIDAAIRGEEVFITKDMLPIVKLVAVKNERKMRKPGSAIGLVHIADDFDEPLEDFKEYM